jgi:hypothetical protein
VPEHADHRDLGGVSGLRNEWADCGADQPDEIAPS